MSCNPWILTISFVLVGCRKCWNRLFYKLLSVRLLNILFCLTPRVKISLPNSKPMISWAITRDYWPFSCVWAWQQIIWRSSNTAISWVITHGFSTVLVRFNPGEISYVITHCSNFTSSWAIGNDLSPTSKVSSDGKWLGWVKFHDFMSCNPWILTILFLFSGCHKCQNRRFHEL